jgi:hypothetical protein
MDENTNPSAENQPSAGQTAEQPLSPELKSQSKKLPISSIVIIILSATTISLGAATGYLLLSRSQESPQNSDNAEVEDSANDNSADDNSTSNSNNPEPSSYTTELAKLTFDYPQGWTVSAEHTTLAKPSADHDFDPRDDKYTITAPNGETATLREFFVNGMGGACPQPGDDAYDPLHITRVIYESPAKIDSSIYVRSYFSYQGKAVGDKFILDLGISVSGTSSKDEIVQSCDLGLYTNFLSPYRSTPDLKLPESIDEVTFSASIFPDSKYRQDFIDILASLRQE